MIKVEKTGFVLGALTWNAFAVLAAAAIARLGWELGGVIWRWL